MGLERMTCQSIAYTLFCAHATAPLTEFMLINQGQRVITANLRFSTLRHRDQQLK